MCETSFTHYLSILLVAMNQVSMKMMVLFSILSQVVRRHPRCPLTSQLKVGHSASLADWPVSTGRAMALLSVARHRCQDGGREKQITAGHQMGSWPGPWFA